MGDVTFEKLGGVENMCRSLRVHETIHCVH